MQNLSVLTLRLRSWVIIFSVTLMLSGCPWNNSSKNEMAEAQPNIPEQPATPEPEATPTSLQVLIVDENYQAITETLVSLKTGDTIVEQMTDAEGFVTFELDYSELSFPVQLSSNKSGFSPQIKHIDDLIEQGENYFQLTMIKRNTAISVDIDNAVDLVTLDGARVVLPAGSLVDSEGNAVSGMVDVFITPLDITKENALSLFPGEFLGTESDQQPVPILSYGTTEFHFEQQGEELNLALWANAGVELPIYVDQHPNGNPIELGETIEFWHLDESTGIWQNYPDGVVQFSNRSPTRMSLRATVPHFSWWNADVAPATTRVTFNLTGDFTGDCRIEVSALAGSLRTPRARVTSLVSTSSSKQYTVPINTPIAFTASLNANGQTYYGSAGVVAQADTEQIEINLLPAGIDNSQPVPVITDMRASVKAIFTKGDADDEDFIHDSNEINFSWQTLAGKPRQSGCTTTDDNAAPDNVSLVLTSDAKRYSEVTLGNSQGNLIMQVDSSDTIDQAGNLINKDPDPITLTLTASNSHGQTQQVLMVDNKPNAKPEIIRVSHFSDDHDQSLVFQWQVEGADTARIDYWQGEAIDINNDVAATLEFDPIEDEIVNLGLANTELGAYIRVNFINIYGTSYRDFVLGEGLCLQNTDLPACGQ